MNRLQKLRHKLIEEELEALLVSQPENYRYLSGFTGSSGWLFISNDSALLAVDFRYTEQASRETANFEVTQVEGELTDWFPKLALNSGARGIGFEAEHLSFATYQQLTEAVIVNQYQLQLIPTAGLVKSMRIIKEPREIELITRAAELVDAAIDYIKSIIHPELTEREIAWEIERFLREGGSEAVPFDLIVASGPNAALPHAKPTGRIICPGEPIIIDIGARIDGYCSDLTRTLCLEKPSETFSKIYDVVLEAQFTAINSIKAGMSGSQADQLARTIINQAGYGEAFGHSLGHGIGLAAHESPRLSTNSSDSLSNGMVFTIEPGIYISGWGGIRIEDMVTLERDKIKVLSKASKTLS